MNRLSTQQLNQGLDDSLWPYFESISFENSGEASSIIQTVACAIRIEPSLSFFAGHFPDQPVLPGVVQVHWVGELAQKLFSCSGFSSLKKVKFSNTILPSASVQLVLNHRQSSGDVSFKYSDEHKDFSSGVIAFQ